MQWYAICAIIPGGLISNFGRLTNDQFWKGMWCGAGWLYTIFQLVCLGLYIKDVVH